MMDPGLATPPDLSLPSVFGRYLLLRRISRGGMGEIFLARSGQLSGFEKLCVIKKVLTHLAADREFIRRFVDEAQVAIKLGHASIAQVFEVGMVEGEYFLALEWVDGRDLRRTLARLADRRQRMPVELGLLIMRDVASGLAYAHRRTDDKGQNINLVHCDISPPNVIVAFEGEVKIVDFGIAKSVLRTAETNPKMGFGKYGYMAPEQLVQGGKVDRRTDVYASGVLLYELLTGRRMFIFPEGADYRQMARIVTQGQHPKPSEIDSGLREFDDLVLRAVAPDPAARYQTAEDLRDALQVALAARSPTLTNDRLGGFMRDLFAEEMAEEQEQLRQETAIDLAPFAEEMSDGRTETVSFAVADEITAIRDSFARRKPPLAPPEDSAPVPKVEPAVGRPVLVDETPSSLQTPARRGPSRRTIGIAAAAGMGLAAALFWPRGGNAPQPPPPAPASAPAVAPPKPVQPFVVQPILPPPPAPATQPASAPASAPTPPPPVHVARPEHPTRQPVRPVSPPPAVDEPTAASVQAKYQALAREYATFKKAYGARLDGEWNDILDYATYGVGEEKTHKLDAKLSAFRKRMAQVKAGGN
jgi:serine/threonine-protein kinase